ncbi:trehalose-phosphatase [Batrachochytrium salamandrivorans]|nr:trehalose-phosphatase [Batrachochytrium salamandrivorans]
MDGIGGTPPLTDGREDQWPYRRLLVVSLFLPYTPCAAEMPPTIVKMQPHATDIPQLTRRLSLLSSMTTMATMAAQTVSTASNSSHRLEHSSRNHLHPIDLSKCTVEPSSAGNIGLQNAINAFSGMASDHLWIGTIGVNTDNASALQLDVLKNRFIREHASRPVFVLWKPFHYQLPDYPKLRGYEESAWQNYKIVNQKFANAIAEEYREGDIVWVNDYHLMLVPLMVRQLIPTASIAFFLHIPFPSSEIFRCLPGIDLSSFNAKRTHPEVAEIITSLRVKYNGMHIVIGRDKNDYVKGVRQKLLAFERFLIQYPEWCGRVVLIQVALSTTEANELETHVSDVVSRINSRFGGIAYVPVVYLQQDISFNHYLALLSIADACLITSLRDGMNLTSHEYVVCQETKHSPLIISEFAGTYGSFGAAIRINPWDGQEVADAIHEALTMTADEKQYRWNMLYQYVSTNTAQSFAETFVADAARVHSENMTIMSASISRLSFESLCDSYICSRKRLFLLDDEGTLFSNPLDSAILLHTTEISRAKKLLNDLCKDERNIVYLMSGRRRSDLDSFFEIPLLGICAENGAFIKYSDRSKWETVLQDQDFSWRKKVLEVFEYYTDRTPGSFIEKKEIGISWYYGLADTGFGAWQAAECHNHLQNTVTATYPVHIISKKKCVEVMPCNVSKATMTRRILEHHQVRSKHRNPSYSPYPVPLQSYSPQSVAPRILSPSVASFRLGSFIDHGGVPGESDLFLGSLEPYEATSPSHVSREIHYRGDPECDQSDHGTINTGGTSFPGTDGISIASIESHSSHCTSPYAQRHSVQASGSSTHVERIDFVLCIGNDRSDEHMFEYLGRLAARENKSRRTKHTIHDAPFVYNSEPQGDGMMHEPDTSSRDAHSSPISEPTEGVCSSPLSPDVLQASSLPFELTTASAMLSRQKGKRYRKIITCTVGAKSSSAKSYVPNVASVLDGLEYLYLHSHKTFFT